MPSYWQILSLILPVFALIAIGVVVRRVHWIEGEAETSLIRLVVNLCYPCLIFDSVVGNAALNHAENLMLPPLMGFSLTALTIGICFYCGRVLGLTVGGGLGFLVTSVRFLVQAECRDLRGRDLFLASIIYLPSVMAALMIDCLR